MPNINTTAKEITAKIVYYGPGVGGKTTNLEQIFQRVDPQRRGKMVSLATDQDRTLFFDLLPVAAGRIGPFQLKFQLYTVPGQVYYNASRRLVLQQVDGIVFVADSSPERLDANLESMQNLYDNLAGLHLDLATLPLVIQYNKRDVSGALPTDVLQQALNFRQATSFQAIANQGVGVFETLAEIMALVEQRLRLPV